MVLGGALIIFMGRGGVGLAGTTPGKATILTPGVVGGAGGRGDERDVDIYPAVAYDHATGRYLAVWFTVRNAGSSSDGFDVYGVFLDHSGSPTGSEFRISDDNTAARSGSPAVAVGNGEFVVVWTAKTGRCKIYAQRVTDTSARSDQTLVSGVSHNHSPSLVYNPGRQRYTLAFVEGDDYLSPTLFGAQTADCGNNASSTSQIKALEFHFSGDSPVVDTQLDISDVTSGAFRPRLAYSAGLNQYLVAWEDRRNAGGETYRFDIYAQRLNSNMTIKGADTSLATDGDYTNDDTSATWTPRPVVTGGNDNFLTAWFSHETEDSAAIWSVAGRLVPSSGSPSSTITITQMTYAQQHTGQAPTGFLAATYNGSAGEYLVGMTSHLESVWGYISFALIQRMSLDGQLLNLDGSMKSQPGVGNSVDYDNDDQISIALAVNPISSMSTTDYLVVYGKHAPTQHSQDFDIWGARVQMPAPYLKNVYLPLVCKEP